MRRYCRGCRGADHVHQPELEFEPPHEVMLIDLTEPKPAARFEAAEMVEEF